MEHHIGLGRALRPGGDIYTVRCCCGFTGTVPARTPASFSPWIALGYGLHAAIEQALAVATQADADLWGEVIATHLVNDDNLAEAIAEWSRPN